jgi:signal transduction histidine kinase
MRSVDEFVERLNRSRETFLGVLGHDLRDPLSTIITGARFLIEERTDEAATREMAHRILATGKRMHQLIADLLDFTQTRLGRPMPIERRKTDLAGVVRNVADEFVTAHPDRPLRMDIAGDLTGQWDAKRMSQAVSNLVGNAIHHGTAESPIDVSAKADDNEVTIVVHNEGVIPVENKAHLFEPMSPTNADKGGARRSKHLGLGLYIAKAIVSGHGGRIDVDSTPERGTTFTIHVPRQPEGEAAVESKV